MPIDINQLENMLKPSVLGWINQAISAAALSGITVTLPQNVAYLDIEQSFIAKKTFSISTANSEDTPLNTNNIYGLTTGNANGIYGQVDASILSGDTSGILYGGKFAGKASDAAFNITGDLGGVWALGWMTTPRTVAQLQGVFANVVLDAAGTATNSIGVEVRLDATAAATISNHYGILARDASNTGGATITKVAGIAIEQQTGTNSTNLLIGTNVTPAGTYSIYNASTRDNFMGGSVTISKTIAAATGAPLTLSQFTLLSAADTSAIGQGLEGSFITDTTDSHNHTGSFVGAFGFSQHLGSGTVSAMRGLVGAGANGGAGAITSLYGARLTLTNSGAGTVSTGYGLYAVNPTVSAGTITAAAGIAVENFTTALKNTNLLIGNGGTVPTDQNWSIYNASTYANFIGGSVTVDNRLTLKQISKPSSPAANYNSIYPKSDNNWYGLTSGGVETQLGGSGSAGTATDVQIFATPGTATWNEPTGAKWTSSMVVGGGGGGGGGRVGATAGGGAGGSGGGVSMDWWPASVMGTAETVITGAGGGGGLGTTSGNGNDGTAGADSKFGNWIAARGGALGAGGNNATAAGGAGGAGLLATGGGGGAGSVTAGGPGSSSVMGGGGGGGGGGNTGPGAGGAGGQGATLGQSPAVGAAGSSPAGVGGTGTASTANSGEGGSGGGGGGGRTTAGTAGAGGPGGKYGGGGGGGGGATTGSTSGAGAAGADGIVIVITTF